MSECAFDCPQSSNQTTNLGIRSSNLFGRTNEIRRLFASGQSGSLFQQASRVRHVGVLMSTAADHPESQKRLAAFLQGLQESGWASAAT
jgi:hypothetical protein